MLVQQDKTLLDDLRCQLRACHTIPPAIADLALTDVAVLITHTDLQRAGALFSRGTLDLDPPVG